MHRPGGRLPALRHRPGAVGLPILDEALAALECAVVDAHPAGDHTIFVGQVEAVDVREDSGREPLLYFRGKYSRLHPHQPGG